MCLSDSYGLGELYEEWYAKQHLERDFVKVSKDRIESTSMTGLLDTAFFACCVYS